MVITWLVVIILLPIIQKEEYKKYLPYLKKHIEIINPKILQHTKDTVLELEGCLSFPNVYVKVNRPKEILVEYYDENLNVIFIIFEVTPSIGVLSLD